jgi:hypothetical protein
MLSNITGSPRTTIIGVLIALFGAADKLGHLFGISPAVAQVCGAVAILCGVLLGLFGVDTSSPTGAQAAAKVATKTMMALLIAAVLTGCTAADRALAGTIIGDVSKFEPFICAGIDAADPQAEEACAQDGGLAQQFADIIASFLKAGAKLKAVAGPDPIVVFPWHKATIRVHQSHLAAAKRALGVQ